MTKGEKTALYGLYNAAWMGFQKAREAYVLNCDPCKSKDLLLKMEGMRSRWAGIDDVVNELTGSEEPL